MKNKNYRCGTIFLLFLTSMYVVNLNHVGLPLSKVIGSETGAENMQGMLKSSFIDEWDMTIEWNATMDYETYEGVDGIAVDSTTGDIYVLGHNGWHPSPHYFKPVLTKYNGNGELQWNITWGQGLNGTGLGLDIALDSKGYIYITGYTGNFFDANNGILLKFNPLGELEWNRTWNREYSDAGKALKIDDQDNIYVTGDSRNNVFIPGPWNDQNFKSDVILLKYNSSGVLVWNTTFIKEMSHYGWDLALDSSNNIYVIGLTRLSPSNENFFLIKFNSSGGFVWYRKWEESGSQYGNGIVIDSHDNIYIAGHDYYDLNNTIFVLKVDYEGNTLWIQEYWNHEGRATCIGIDSEDNIYLGGSVFETDLYSYNALNYYNASILKYSASGELLWVKLWDSSNSHLIEDIVLDSFGKIYIAGTTDRIYNNSYIYDNFVVKISSEIEEIVLNIPGFNIVVMLSLVTWFTSVILLAKKLKLK